MKIDAVPEISSWLERAGGLSESLLHELCLSKFGYSIHAVFRVMVDGNGRTLAEPREVVLNLDAVERLDLQGGLTSRMVEHPEEINWGLSEVALVQVTPVNDGVQFEALWEGDRKLEVRCRRASLTIRDHPDA